MRLAALGALLVSALLSSGCLVVGLHPFYEDGAIEFDEALLGTWQSAEENGSVRVERGPWRSYRVTSSKAGDEEVYTGYLTRLGSVRLLDLAWCTVPEESPLMTRVHLPVRVQVLGDVLTLAPLDYDWFRGELQHGRLGALNAALDEQENVLLAAPTAAVRAWLAAHAADRFDEAARYTRRPAG